MRKLTILRRKTFVACLGKMRVYIEDPISYELGINNIPCMILFENGEPKKTIVGYRTKQQLKTIITEK